jgi:hypothetical protein
LQAIDAAQVRKEFALAESVFKASVDNEGFLIKTGLKFNKDENDQQLKAIFADLAKRGALQVPIAFVPQKDTTDDVLAAVETELGAVQLPVDILTDEELAKIAGFADDINAEFGSLAYAETLRKELDSIDIQAIVGDIFAKTTETSNEEIAKQGEDLRKQLNDNVITYQEYVNELGLLERQRTEDRSAADKVIESLNAGLSTGFTAAIDAMAESYAKLSEGIADGSATIGDAMKLVATEGALQFGKMIAEGENAGTAILKTAGAMAQKLLALYTPEILALFSATIPPPFGIIAGTAAVAALNGILNAALSGFEEGGFTGGTSSKEVRGVVHGKEWVANAGITQREKGLFQFLQAGGTSEAYYKQFMATDMKTATGRAVVTSDGAIVSILSDVRDTLARIPNESMMRHNVGLEVGFDSYLYQKNMKRQAVRRLR